MYTGIVEAVGQLARIEKRGSGARIKIMTPPAFDCAHRVKTGDSVAANGVCVTATQIFADSFWADVSGETMALTCFKYYQTGEKLNLELPCTPATHLGGHIVQGHVDGIGTMRSLQQLSEAINVWVEAPADLLPYIALKGSIAVDGMSLTVNSLEGNAFRLTLIPHTQQVTNFASFVAGRKVNLEVDVLARYLERLFVCGALSLSAPAGNAAADRAGAKAGKSQSAGGLKLETLLRQGF